MNEFAPGTAFSCEFTTSNPTTGARSNADATPSAVAVRNGAVDGAFSLAVAAVAGQTGVYSVSGTVPGGYASGDRVSVVATATVAGVTGSGAAAAFRVRSGTIDAVKLKTDLIPASPATEESVTSLGSAVLSRASQASVDALPSSADNAEALLSAVAEDNGAGGAWTVKAMLRLMFSFLNGERGGGGTNPKTFAVPGGTKTRVAMTTDANGNSVGAHTLDASDA